MPIEAVGIFECFGLGENFTQNGFVNTPATVGMRTTLVREVWNIVFRKSAARVCTQRAGIACSVNADNFYAGISDEIF